MDDLKNITLEAYIEQKWVDVASIEFSSDFKVSRVNYSFDYALENLNLCDNHGRNTSFVLFDNQIKFAPIYDFAPMKADPEGISRTAKWSTQYEQADEFDYIGIAKSFSDLADVNIIIKEMKRTATQLAGLKERLQKRDVPDSILNMPTFGFDFIPEKLTRWGLV